MQTDLLQLVDFVFSALTLAIIGRALISWVDPGMQTPVGKFLRQITEPLIAPVRQIVPTMGMFDISPIIVLVLLQVVQRMLWNVLAT